MLQGGSMIQSGGGMVSGGSMTQNGSMATGGAMMAGGSMGTGGGMVTGRRIGLGVMLQRSADGSTFIQDVVPGFAAALSGQIQSGDVIVSINGTVVQGWDLEDIKQHTSVNDLDLKDIT
ncbi:hypothetical protein T484DRAFT_1831294 [Baffinella frigidus]|nr:hypothetical protein T484DRAFT_1831294 [Cryptophyta sp. CCMP2293]